MHDEPLRWGLYDCRAPLTHDQADFPFTAISDERCLRRQLERFQQMDAGILYLVSPTDDALRIGLGGKVGVLQCRLPSSEFNGQYAQSGTMEAGEFVEFASEGLDEPFWSPNLLPPEEVIAAAVHFYKTQQLAPGMCWGARYWGEYKVAESD